MQTAEDDNRLRDWYSLFNIIPARQDFCCCCCCCCSVFWVFFFFYPPSYNKKLNAAIVLIFCAVYSFCGNHINKLGIRGTSPAKAVSHTAFWAASVLEIDAATPTNCHQVSDCFSLFVCYLLFTPNLWNPSFSHFFLKLSGLGFERTLFLFWPSCYFVADPNRSRVGSLPGLPQTLRGCSSSPSAGGTRRVYPSPQIKVKINRKTKMESVKHAAPSSPFFVGELARSALYSDDPFFDMRLFSLFSHLFNPA